MLKFILFLMKILEGSNLLRLAKSKSGLTIGAILLGAVASFSIAPLEIWPCIIIAYVFFMMQLSCLKTKKGVFFLSLVFFASNSYLSLTWLNFVMEGFGELPAFLSNLVIVLFSIFYIALPYATLNVIAFKIAGKKTEAYLCFFLPLALIGGDFYVSYVLTGFPWILPGYSCVEGPLKNYAPLVGVRGISALIYVISGAIALTALRKFLYLPLAAAILFIGLFAEGISYTKDLDKKIDVLMVQGNIEQQVRSQSKSTIEIFSIYWNETKDKIKQDALIIWPESALPIPFEYQKEFFSNINEAFNDKGANLITGLFSLNTDEHKIYNSLVSLGNDKTIDESTIYHKRALVPFGEIVPFADLLRPLGSIFVIPNSSFNYGEKEQSPIKVHDMQFTPAICYEAIFPELIASMDNDKTNGIVMISNDSWFGPTKAPVQHLNIARMRALELQKPMLRDTNSGITAYIDKFGVVQKTLPSDVEGALEVTFTPAQGQSPYSRFGNTGLLVIAVLLLGAGIYRLYKKDDELDEKVTSLVRP